MNFDMPPSDDSATTEEVSSEKNRSATEATGADSSQSAMSVSVKIANSSDQPTEEDSLGFEPYVKAIAAFLVDEDTKPPLTLSIEGEWGCGKSSFMKQLQKEIKRLEQNQNADREQVSSWRRKEDGLKSPARIIEFNAWRHDKAEALWAAFALEFLRQVSKPLPTEGLLEGLWIAQYKNLKLFWSRLNWEENWREIIRISFQSIFFLVVLIVLLSSGFDRVQKTSDQVLCMWKEEEQEDASDNQASSTPTPSPAPAGNVQSGTPPPCQGFEGNILYFVLVLASGAGSASGLKGLFSRFWQSFSDPKNDLTKLLTIPKYDEQIAFIEKFHEDFDKIVDAYAGKYKDKPKKVYVFIDDLDRCELSKSADLMQAINLMIDDNPHLVFILGMDREKVAASIALKQAALLPYLLSSSTVLDVENAAQSENHKSIKGLEYGYAFMEKFIQLPFQVPQPSEFYFKRFLDNLNKTSTPIPTPASTEAQLAANNSDAKINKTEISGGTATPERQPSNKSSSVDESIDESIEQTRQYLRINRDQDEDSKNIQQITLMVGEFLDWNPRRVKQFINLFRLKVFIAAATGLFIPNKENQALTLEQIGKYTAICVKYPRLQIDLGKKPDLLGKLEEFSISTENSSPNQARADNSPKVLESVTYWANQPGLVKLLQKENHDPAFSLKNVRIQQLIRVASHPVDRVELKSEREVDYTRLRDLLRDEQWRKADKETRQVMLRAARREEEEYLDEEDIKSFPCEDLQTIDQLWVVASKNKFGFSVQKRILGICNSPMEYGVDEWKNFVEHVGWWVREGVDDFRDRSLEGKEKEGELPHSLFPYYTTELPSLDFKRPSPPKDAMPRPSSRRAAFLLFSRVETCQVNIQ